MNDDDASDAIARLQRFLADGRFAASGGFMTDLDGTAVLEREGLIVLPPEVELGMKRVHDHRRPIIANTLRFPLSVIRVFGEEWQRATRSDLPLVSMKGSQIGQVTRDASGASVFDEWHATTLDAAEIAEVLDNVESLVGDGLDDLLVFHYARDWTKGERIWTPDATRIAAVADKYRSASHVMSGPVSRLRDTLAAEPFCMVFVLVDVPEDRRMAYQHTQRASFFTHRGTNKRTGAEAMASHLGVDLAASIGAGDAPTDEFLAAVGFAIVVGPQQLEFKGRADTVRVDSIEGLGRLLDAIGRATG